MSNDHNWADILPAPSYEEKTSMSKKQRVDYAALPWDEIFEAYQFGESEKRAGRRPSQTELAEKYAGCRKNFGIWFRAEARRRGIHVRAREEAAGMPTGKYMGTGSNRRLVQPQQ